MIQVKEFHHDLPDHNFDVYLEDDVLTIDVDFQSISKQFSTKYRYHQLPPKVRKNYSTIEQVFEIFTQKQNFSVNYVEGQITIHTPNGSLIILLQEKNSKQKSYKDLVSDIFYLRQDIQILKQFVHYSDSIDGIEQLKLNPQIDSSCPGAPGGTEIFSDIKIEKLEDKLALSQKQIEEIKGSLTHYFSGFMDGEHKAKESVIQYQMKITHDEMQKFKGEMNEWKAKFEIKKKQIQQTGTEYEDTYGKFKGELNNGKPHGFGIQLCVDGAKYEGQYKNGMQFGKGILHFPDGTRYEGQYKYGLQNGNGIQYYTNGERYEGQWKNGKKNGKGVELFANGDKYEGEWLNGEKNGKGMYTYNNGNIYVGDYKSGKPHGKATQYFDKGEKFQGEFSNGFKNGKGSQYFQNGDVFKGQYKDGLRNGHCIMFYANGDREVGEVQGNKWLGSTTLYYASGLTKTNVYANGVLVS